MSELYEVWKYQLLLTSTPQFIRMPCGAGVLHVADQNGTICLWALCDPEAARVERIFCVVGTGHPIDFNLIATYVGTVQQGKFVWHVFELDREQLVKAGLL